MQKKNNIRIIPRLDIKGPNLVKGIHLEGLRVLGAPAKFAKFYYDNGADELMYQDVVASLYNRNTLKDFIEKTAKEIFIPLTVGGGIRTLGNIKEILRAGADKVSLNTAAIKNPEFIKEASRKFGSSTIVISIEAIKQLDGSYFAFVDNGREQTGVEVSFWAKQVEELGAGEIIITSVDREGTGSGFDYELINLVNDSVSIPVIAHGGAGCISDIEKILDNTKLHSLAIASILHYKTIFDIDTIDNESNEGNKDYLRSGKTPLFIKPASIMEIKKSLMDKGFECRI